MTVLLTGGSGFLGSHVAERLSQAGVPCRALVREKSDTRFLATLPNVTLVVGSLDNPDSLRSAVRGVDSVIHSAGLVKARRRDDFHRTNVVGTENLIRAVLSECPNLQRFVMVSSLAAAGPSSDGSPVAQDSVAPVTHYGRSKAEAEAVVKRASEVLPVTILRPSAIYGPRDREILAFFQAVKWGIVPLTSRLDARLSMVHGADCASACFAALTADVESGSAWYVEDGASDTFATLISQIEVAVGRRVRLKVPIPGPILWGAASASEMFGFVSGRPVMLTRDKLNELRASHWVCDASTTRAALGWEPRLTFAEGAGLTAEWYRRVGWL
jgi:nucleoside-diphosphate-sugar epimerase